MLQLQEALQREAFGINFDEMNAVQVVQYIRDQHQALGMELSEALDEVEWKPWAQTFLNPRINRGAFVGELVDVLHFWMNMALAVSGSSTIEELADEIFTRYALKNRTNVQRQVDGYDGRSTKCGGCGRAVDDVAVQCTREGDQGYCAQTDSDINYITNSGYQHAISVHSTPIERCSRCDNLINEFGCVPPTTERWGHCGCDERQLPPIKISTT
jgi:hypothetical protein